MESSDYLFVYGTLMRGFDNEIARYLAETQSFYGKAYFSGILFNVSFYPGAVYQHEAAAKVHGHLFSIDNNKGDLLKKLDYYEGIDPLHSETNEFIRKIIPVKSGQKIYSAYTYLFNKPFGDYHQIESGDFQKFIDRKKGL